MANQYTNRDLLDFNYKESDKVNLAGQQKTAAEQALSNYGPYNFTYGRQADYDSAMDAILNRKKFSYDLNGDALYQQYKDNYINQGKMAMMDTMGQASAMTGGYGNSYAATVGNQAYQASLQNLNNMIPQLYQLALESYKTEGDRLNNNLNVLGTDRELQETSYNNKYSADLSRLTSDREYYGEAYNKALTFDYNNQKDTVDLNNQAYWNEYNTGYKAARDAIADEQWQKNYDLQSDMSSYQNKISSLESQIEGLNEKYKGYISPEIQKAANSTATKNFMAAILTKNELARRNMSANINGETKRFDNYTQYVETVLEKQYNNGQLTQNEVAYLKGYYGIE